MVQEIRALVTGKFARGELSSAIRVTLAYFAARDRALSTSGTTPASADQHLLQAKKLLATLSLRITTLGDALSSLPMTEGELIRRKDLLQNLKNEKDRLAKLVTQRQQESALYVGESLSPVALCVTASTCLTASTLSHCIYSV